MWDIDILLRLLVLVIGYLLVSFGLAYMLDKMFSLHEPEDEEWTHF